MSKTKPYQIGRIAEDLMSEAFVTNENKANQIAVFSYSPQYSEIVIKIVDHDHVSRIELNLKESQQVIDFIQKEMNKIKIYQDKMNELKGEADQS